jgi:hypothetical protein
MNQYAAYRNQLDHQRAWKTSMSVEMTEKTAPSHPSQRDMDMEMVDDKRVEYIKPRSWYGTQVMEEKHHAFMKPHMAGLYRIMELRKTNPNSEQIDQLLVQEMTRCHVHDADMTSDVIPLIYASEYDAPVEGVETLITE